MQIDVNLLHEIEEEVGEKLEEFECKENEVLEDIQKVLALLLSLWENYSCVCKHMFQLWLGKACGKIFIEVLEMIAYVPPTCRFTQPGVLQR